MPTARVNGVDIFYEDVGKGIPVIFGHSLVWDHEMFVHQVKALSGNYRCINVDYRNHGRSGGVHKEWTIHDYVDDNIALAEHLGIKQAHWVGLSQGGMMAMRLALKRPDLVRSLLILDSSAEGEEEANIPNYEMMANMAAEQGPETVVEGVMPIFFAADFNRDQPDQIAAYRKKFIDGNSEALKWAVFAVTRRDDVSKKISAIKAPTLVIVGEQDSATVPAHSELIARSIPGATLVTIPGAGHMSPLEKPEPVNRALSEFLARVDA
ncbi:MAG: alpha/beta fold hydrolase [Deltaproteobacteria bacterium]|nr:alpha/beta fold hydrolase [Deltaproteobacteria bacterium]